MDIEEALQTYFLSKTEITDILGTGTAFRLFPDFARGGTAFPYATYQISGTEPAQHLEGSSELYGITMEYDIWGTSKSSVRSVAKALRNLLDGFLGVMGDFDIRGSRLENEFDRFENPTQGDDIGTFNRVITFEIWYNRPIPTLP